MSTLSVRHYLMDERVYYVSKWNDGADEMIVYI